MTHVHSCNGSGTLCHATGSETWCLQRQLAQDGARLPTGASSIYILARARPSPALRGPPGRDGIESEEGSALRDQRLPISPLLRYARAGVERSRNAGAMANRHAHKKLRAEIRARMAVTCESYQRARAHILARPPVRAHLTPFVSHGIEGAIATIEDRGLVLHIHVFKGGAFPLRAGRW